MDTVAIGASQKTLLLLCVALLNLRIALYVLQRGRDARQRRSFAFLCFTVAFWSATLSVEPLRPELALLLRRLAHAAASLVVLAIVLFAASFQEGRSRFPSRHRYLLAAISLVVFALCFSPWIIPSVQILPGGPLSRRGPLHTAFVLYVILYFALGTGFLAASYRTASSRIRTQIRYIFLAIALPGPVALATNLFIPMFAATTRFAFIGPSLSLVTLALIGHSMVHYRLMDMRVVVRRGTVTIVAVIASAAVFALVMLAANSILSLPQPFTSRDVIVALAAGACLPALRRHLERLANRYLLRHPYSFRAVVRDTSRALAGTIHTSDLLGYLGVAIDRTLRPEHVGIYLLDGASGPLRLVWHTEPESLPPTLSVHSPCIVLAQRDRPLLFRDEIDQRSGNAAEMAAFAELTALNIEALVPMAEKHEVLGLVVLGPKRNGEAYFSDDADLLTTLVSQAALAVRNAQAHERVVEIKEELQTVLATIDSGVITMDASRRIRIFNAAAERLTGIATTAAIGGPVECLPAAIADALQGNRGGPQSRPQWECTLAGPNGRPASVLCSRASLSGAGGANLGTVIVLDDLSHLKELERERHRAERLAAIEAVASGLVHEVRNPLVAMKTFVQMLPARGEDRQFRENFTRVVGREIGRIDELLNRFRALAHPPSQPMSRLDIVGPLQAAIELIRARLETHGIALSYGAESAPPPVVGNASQLEQLFLNLLLNAIEAMEEGGELSVRVGESAALNGRAARVEVGDTGPGIPPELLPRIFNPFVTTKTQGTGLGLAICRSIGDAHRAHLEAHNNDGKPGCTFVVEFPAAEVSDGQPERLSSPAESAAGR
jgi:signal transduction histidine kinase